MTDQILFSISGLQFADGNEADPVEVITGGSYRRENSSHIIEFEEVTEGFEGVTKNKILMNPDKIEVHKEGVTNVQMLFEIGKKNTSCYHTPFGSLLVAIQARDIQMKEEQDMISADISYDLDINYEHIAECEIHMKVRSKEGQDFTLS